MLVTNSQSNDVVLLPGVGQGFFNDQNPRIYSVGTDPGPTFVGNFNGQTDLVTVNAGSNDLTLIAGFEGANPTISTIPSGGVAPDAAFAFGSGGFDNLVVGNAGDGVLALFEGSSEGLALTSSETAPDLPSPTALAFLGLTGGQVQFYAATEGQEAAALVALSLGGGEVSPLSAPASPTSSGVAQLVPLQESSLALVGTLLTVTIDSSSGALPNPGETDAVAALALSSAAPVSLGQPVFGQGGLAGPGSDGDEQEPVQPGEPAARPGIPGAPAWQRYTLGTDEAIKRFDREHPDLSPSRSDDASGTHPGEGKHGAGSAPPAGVDQGQSEFSSPNQDVRAEAADKVIDILCGDDRLTGSRHWWSEATTVGTGFRLAATDPSSIARGTGSALVQSLAAVSRGPGLADRDDAIRLPGRSSGERIEMPALLVLTSLVAGYVYFGPAGPRARSSNRWTGTRRWHRV